MLVKRWKVCITLECQIITELYEQGQGLASSSQSMSAVSHLLLLQCCNDRDHILLCQIFSSIIMGGLLLQLIIRGMCEISSSPSVSFSGLACIVIM